MNTLLPMSEEEKRASEFALHHLRKGSRYNDRVLIQITPKCFHKRNREQEIFPYSIPHKAEALRNLAGGPVFREYSVNLNREDHIMADGTHRLFFFDHLLYSRQPPSFVVGQTSRDTINDAAKSLSSLAESLFFSPKQKQLEFWPRAVNYDGFVLLGDVKHERDSTPFVILNSSCLLALEAATAWFKGNGEAQRFIDFHQKKEYSLPLVKPQIYFVDNKTKEIYRLGDTDREHLWGDREILQIIPDLVVGGDLTLERSDDGFHGILFLIATK